MTALGLSWLTLQCTVCCKVMNNLLSSRAASTSTVKVVTIAALNDTHFIASECKTSQQLPHFWVCSLLKGITILVCLLNLALCHTFFFALFLLPYSSLYCRTMPAFEHALLVRVCQLLITQLQNLLDPTCEPALQAADLKIVLRVVRTVLRHFYRQLKTKCGVFIETLLAGM